MGEVNKGLFTKNLYIGRIFNIYKVHFRCLVDFFISCDGDPEKHYMLLYKKKITMMIYVYFYANING